MSPDSSEFTKILLANAAKLLEQQLDESSLSVGPFTKFAFPLIRKTAPALVATSLVSVQPMTQPVGGVAFYKGAYGKPPPKPKIGDTVRSLPGAGDAIVGTIIAIEERHGKYSSGKTEHAIVETIEGYRVVVALDKLEKISALDALAKAANVETANV